MSISDSKQRRGSAAATFGIHENRGDALRVINSLCDGLDLLRESFYARVHLDVENIIGADSMMIPLSAIHTEEVTLTEIDAYLVSETVAEIRTAKYVADDEWFCRWLRDLRLTGAPSDRPIDERLTTYLSKQPDDRRRTFSLTLERTFPEARRSPLIVYRLLPLAATIVASLAFGDIPRAEAARRRQTSWLPHISDCHECHGRLMENGEKCPQCGNPFWNFDWLTAD